jgi:hypothetical protein
MEDDETGVVPTCFRTLRRLDHRRTAAASGDVHCVLGNETVKRHPRERRYHTPGRRRNARRLDRDERKWKSQQLDETGWSRDLREGLHPTDKINLSQCLAGGAAQALAGARTHQACVDACWRLLVALAPGEHAGTSIEVDRFMIDEDLEDPTWCSGLRLLEVERAETRRSYSDTHLVPLLEEYLPSDLARLVCDWCDVDTSVDVTFPLPDTLEGWYTDRLAWTLLDDATGQAADESHPLFGRHNEDKPPLDSLDLVVLPGNARQATLVASLRLRAVAEEAAPTENQFQAVQGPSIPLLVVTCAVTSGYGWGLSILSPPFGPLSYLRLKKLARLRRRQHASKYDIS